MKLRCIDSGDFENSQIESFVEYIRNLLDIPLERVSPEGGWERSNTNGDWMISSARQFLNPDSIRNYWLENENEIGRCGPHIVLPNSKPPAQIKNILLAYSSYPDVEKSFLRVGMDTALRLKAHLHCLKIVKPPQVLWSHRQYAISPRLNCYETITTNESISQGVLDYASENDIDVICLLTRPWSDVILDLSISHSFKVMNNSDRPVMLFREDDVMSMSFKVGA
jgi:hypothetical protein